MISGQGIQLVPHVVHDSCQHQSLGSLSAAVETRGYTGGIQLLLVRIPVSMVCTHALGLHFLHTSTQRLCNKFIVRCTNIKYHQNASVE